MQIIDAFKILLEDSELLAKTGMSDTNRRQYLYKLKSAPDTIITDTMRKYLKKAGFLETSDWVPPVKENPTVETAG